MSEYQYYEFITIERALTKEQMAELRKVSSRAQITPTRFTNVYNYGDFGGDLDQMMTRYFDVMLYYANFGLRRFMLRLPNSVLDAELLASYGAKRSFRVKPGKDCVVLDFEASLEESDDECWELDGKALMEELAPVRAELLQGDLRALYLGWLLCAQQDDLEEGAVEPPIPPGLGALSTPLERLADFLWLDRDLLALAAQGSAQPRPSAGQAGLKEWLAALPAGEKDSLLFSLVSEEDAGLRARLLHRFYASRPRPRLEPGTRTAEVLLEAARAQGEIRRREEERRAEQAEVRRQKKEQADKARRLEALAKRKDAAWEEAERLVSSKEKRAYEEAGALLQDLHELSIKDGEETAFLHRLADLRDRHRSKQAFLNLLYQLGLNLRRPRRSSDS